MVSKSEILQFLHKIREIRINQGCNDWQSGGDGPPLILEEKVGRFYIFVGRFCEIWKKLAGFKIPHQFWGEKLADCRFLLAGIQKSWQVLLQNVGRFYPKKRVPPLISKFIAGLCTFGCQRYCWTLKMNQTLPTPESVFSRFCYSNRFCKKFHNWRYKTCIPADKKNKFEICLNHSKFWEQDYVISCKVVIVI